MTEKIQINTVLETKSTQNEDRVIEVIASKEVKDRDGDVVKLAGMDLEDFKKNPVILFAHDYHQPPVGKAISITKQGDELRMKIQFAKAEEYQFADTVYSLMKGGYLNAVSVGFMADRETMEYITDSKGKSSRVINKSSLYELSVVPVPANQSALVIGRSVSKAFEDGIIDKKAFDEYTSKLDAFEKDSTPDQSTTKEASRIVELEAYVAQLELQIEELKMDADIEKDPYTKIFEKYFTGTQATETDEHTDEHTDEKVLDIETLNKLYNKKDKNND